MDKKSKHREIYPLPFEQINKLSSFEQILGRKTSDYTEEERKARWEKGMSFPGGKEAKEYYSNLYECVDCKHFQKGWCAFASLPCGVNPVLTFQHGILGMACQGVGHELIDGSQLLMEFETYDLPFVDSKDPDDEKHVHPLQLDAIDRIVSLYSNEGEIVLTPFMGVGSEVYSAVSLNRKGIGIELKPSYFKQAKLNLATVNKRFKKEAIPELF